MREMKVRNHWSMMPIAVLFYAKFHVVIYLNDISSF